MIIKCPECGHEVSDKAPTCPHCGLPIAGHVQTAATNNQPAQEPLSAATPTTPVSGQPKKKGNGVIYASLIIALIICGAVFYFYSGAKSDKEQDAYEYAMTSNEPLVLEQYLENFKDAPQEHRDSIEAHLTLLKQADADWNNAVMSMSAKALKDYLESHPNSIHKAEAEHKIDSLDYVAVIANNSIDAYKDYIENHPNGEYVDEANDAMKAIKSKTLQVEERDEIASIFRSFFQAINSKDETSLTSNVANLMTTFLGKSDATRNDVVTFMRKIYKDDINSMTWRIPGEYKIDKKEVGDDEYEYSVTFEATQDIDRNDPTKPKHNKYRVKAKVSPEGKISELNMTKLVE